MGAAGHLPTAEGSWSADASAYAAPLPQRAGLLFADCQEWEWIPRRFHPARAFAQPRSLAAKVNFQPRVISDDIWAKLVWAGLNLTEADLPSSWDNRHFYPLTMMRAVVLVWLFAGLRQDEIRRLRVGCIRYQNGTDPAADAVCLLDVPVNKTSTAFTKPVDRVVGEAMAGALVATLDPALRARHADEAVACVHRRPVL